MSEHESVIEEVTAWFFDDYLPLWIGVGNGTIHKGPEFILDYWGAPLFAYRAEGGRWALDGDAVVGMLAELQTRLRADNYADTAVLDWSVRAYHRNGASIEVIWSRRRADDTEIERTAAHFEAIRTDQGWRVAGIQGLNTDADTLADVWAQR